MARDIKRYEQQIQITGRIPQTQFATGGVKLLESSAAFSLKQAEKMEERSANNAYLRGQSVITRELARMETEFKNDPDNLQKGIENFAGTFLEDVYDPEVRGRLELQLTESGVSAVARATNRRNAIITEQGAYETFMAMDELQTETEQVALDYFSGDPVMQEQASRRLQELMLRGNHILSQAGPDGTPYVSPQQRASFMFGLRDGTFETMANAWFQSQGNSLSAAQDWLDGNVSIQLPNEKGEMETVNMREAMPATARRKSDDAIMGALRDRISIQNHAMALEDRGYEKMAEAAYAEVLTNIQGDPNQVGPPDPTRYDKALSFLDMNRNVFIKGGKSREFFALRESLVAGDPITENSSVKNTLLLGAMQGQNPQEIGISAVQNRQVRVDTLTKAQSIYEQTQGPADNVLTFYTNRANTTIGGLNKTVDGVVAAELSNAPILLNRQYSQFIEKEGRQPTMDEFEPYYRMTMQGIAERSGIAGLLDSAALAPSFVPPSLMAGPKTKQTYDMLQRATINHFTTRYGNDVDEWPADDMELIQADQWLSLYQRELEEASKPKTGSTR